MPRIVVHAGFHKTGTSSVQSMLRTNTEVLAPEVRVYLRENFRQLTEETRAYSLSPTDERLHQVFRKALSFFRRCDRADPRPILMSSEDLAGTIPGRAGIETYFAAPALMAQIARAARARFRNQADVIFFFSTREPESWLRSTWWQNLRSTRLREDFTSYSTRLQDAADHEAVLRAIAQDSQTAM